MMQRLPMQPLSVGPAFGRLLAHTDEIPRSSKCRLLRLDRKWLTYGQNDATGEQGLETVPRQAVVSIYFGTRGCDMATKDTQIVLDMPSGGVRLSSTSCQSYGQYDVAGGKRPAV